MGQRRLSGQDRRILKNHLIKDWTNFLLGKTGAIVLLSGVKADNGHYN